MAMKNENFDVPEQKTSNWTLLWLNHARQALEDAAQEQRLALIKAMKNSLGKAISAFQDKYTQKALQDEAESGFLQIAKELNISEYRAGTGFSIGIQAGPFSDDDQIPAFLVDAWEEAKKEIIEPDTDVEQLPFEAGSVASGDGFVPDVLPPAPLEVFHPAIQSAIKELAETKSVPVEMLVGMMLALGSACIGRSRGVQYRKDWRECANLYFMLIAETSAGKSHTFSYVFKYVKEFEKKQKEAFKIARKEYEEALLAYRKSKDADRVAPKRPPNVQFLLDDSTMEAVSERLEDNPRGLFWAKDEFSGFFESLDRYSKAGSDGKTRLISAWSLQSWNATRKSKDGVLEERYVPDPCIGLFGCIQPHLVKDVFTYGDVKQGLPQRFLYIRTIVDKPMILPTPEISCETDRVLRRITELLLSLEMEVNSAGSTRTPYLTLTPEAKEVFEHFSNELQKNTFKTEAQGFAGKMAQMTLRIALILHFLEWTMTATGIAFVKNPADIEEIKEKQELYCTNLINDVTMQNAVKLMEWLAFHTQYARRFFPGAGERTVSAKETDERKKAILNFVLKNEEFAKEFHSAAEMIEAGLKWHKGQQSLGMYLKELNFSSDRVPGTPRPRTTKYKLSPLPLGFAQPA